MEKIVLPRLAANKYGDGVVAKRLEAVFGWAHVVHSQAAHGVCGARGGIADQRTHPQERP